MSSRECAIAGVLPHGSKHEICRSPATLVPPPVALSLVHRSTPVHAIQGSAKHKARDPRTNGGQYGLCCFVICDML